jgi:putative phosphoesterase
VIAGKTVMRVAALYDIHGNLPALDAVLGEVHRADVDLIVVGGDVFPGPMSCETFARLLELNVPTRFILGNGDREVLAAMRGEETRSLPEQALQSIRWNAGQLTTEQGSAIREWPTTISDNIDGIGETLFCHATPGNDTEIFTKLTPQERLIPAFSNVRAKVVVCGHTHMQFDRKVGHIRVVNAGSVGMPFGEPGAYWVLLGPEIELKRTAYDLAAASKAVRATSYPQAEEFASGSILRPPSEEKMIELFSHHERR